MPRHDGLDVVGGLNAGQPTMPPCERVTSTPSPIRSNRAFRLPAMRLASNVPMFGVIWRKNWSSEAASCGKATPLKNWGYSPIRNWANQNWSSATAGTLASTVLRPTAHGAANRRDTHRSLGPKTGCPSHRGHRAWSAMNAPTALRRAKTPAAGGGRLRGFGNAWWRGRRFALYYGRTGVVFAFTGNYRTVHGKCALLFNG